MGEYKVTTLFWVVEVIVVPIDNSAGKREQPSEELKHSHKDNNDEEEINKSCHSL
jgi:hypothetical protein